jgi:hypothetical protein
MTSGCPSGDGLYCGGDGVSGDANTLYRCTGGTLTVDTVCPNGCQKMPAGTNDQCAPAMTSGCPSGDGLYCGGDGVSGDANTLYRCTGGNLAVVELCATKCQTLPAGQNDRCASGCPSGDGLYCGGDQVNGSSNILYRCTGGALSVAQQCANGCHVAPPGQNDSCQ